MVFAVGAARLQLDFGRVRRREPRRQSARQFCRIYSTTSDCCCRSTLRNTHLPYPSQPSFRPHPSCSCCWLWLSPAVNSHMKHQIGAKNHVAEAAPGGIAGATECRRHAGTKQRGCEQHPAAGGAASRHGGRGGDVVAGAGATGLRGGRERKKSTCRRFLFYHLVYRVPVYYFSWQGIQAGQATAAAAAAPDSRSLCNRLKPYLSCLGASFAV